MVTVMLRLPSAALPAIFRMAVRWFVSVMTRFATVMSPPVPAFSVSGVRNALPVNATIVADPCPPMFGVTRVRVGGAGVTLIATGLLDPSEVTATTL